MIFASYFLIHMTCAVLAMGLIQGRIVWKYPKIADEEAHNTFIFALSVGVLLGPVGLLTELIMRRGGSFPIQFAPTPILLPVPISCLDGFWRHLKDDPPTAGMLREEVAEWLAEEGCHLTYAGNILFRSEQQRVLFKLAFG